MLEFCSKVQRRWSRRLGDLCDAGCQRTKSGRRTEDDVSHGVAPSYAQLRSRGACLIMGTCLAARRRLGRLCTGGGCFGSFAIFIVCHLSPLHFLPLEVAVYCFARAFGWVLLRMFGIPAHIDAPFGTTRLIDVIAIGATRIGATTKPFPGSFTEVRFAP